MLTEFCYILCWIEIHWIRTCIFHSLYAAVVVVYLCVWCALVCILWVQTWVYQGTPGKARALSQVWILTFYKESSAIRNGCVRLTGPWASENLLVSSSYLKAGPLELRMPSTISVFMHVLGTRTQQHCACWTDFPALLFIFWDRVTPCNFRWPGTH